MSLSVSPSCVVLIAPAEHLPALQKRAPASPGGLLAFVDTDPLKALEAIMARRPSVVVLEQAFASTPRGSALVGRIKADPAISHAEIVIVAHDDEESLQALSRAGEPAAPPQTGVAAAPTPLDFRGTRRFPRVRIAEHVRVMVDGHAATLVDLSAGGAQVVSNAVLRPNHRVRVVMADERGSVKCVALVAWASFEIPPKSEPHYRAGLQFMDVSSADVEAYCDRHMRN